MNLRAKEMSEAILKETGGRVGLRVPDNFYSLPDAKFAGFRLIEVSNDLEMVQIGEVQQRV